MTEKDPVKTLGAALTDKLHIDPRECPIAIRMDGDAIVVEGTVERVAQKKRALFIAMGIRGVSGVIDRLRVRPATSLQGVERGTHARSIPHRGRDYRRHR
jgi:hypothetical protein